MAENRESEISYSQHVSGSGEGASPSQSGGHSASSILFAEPGTRLAHPPGYLPPLAPLLGQVMSGPGPPAVHGGGAGRRVRPVVTAPLSGH